MNLFGKAKKAPTAKDSIMKLRETIEMLEKRETYLQKKIDHELEEAKKNAAKNKRGALMALKRKKAYQGQIEKISGAKLTLEQQVMAIEDANINLEAMGAMKMGAQAMRGIHGSLNIDKVDDTMEEIRDQMDIANEINDAISKPVGFGMEFDDDELSAELDELEQEQIDSKLMDIPNTGVKVTPAANKSPAAKAPAAQKEIKFPEAPSTVPKKTETDEEKELRELQASMAM
jgi:charged multivesicular body protein 4